MSSLPDRSGSPRVPRPPSRMHPGWAVFLMSWFSGQMAMAAMMGFILRDGRADEVVAFAAAISTVLFFFAGKRAEGLTDRKP